MVVWSELRRWSPDRVGLVGDHLAARSRRVAGLQDELDDAGPADWSGAAADAAAGDLRARRRELEELAALLSAAVRAVDDAENAVRELVRGAESVEFFASRNGFRIADDRVVQVAAHGGAHLGEVLHAEVRAILTTAAEVDGELDSALRRVLADGTGAAGTTTPAAADPVARHRELLVRHQVKPDGTTTWPSGLTGLIADAAGRGRTTVTLAEADLLDDLQRRRGLLGVKEFADVQADALETAHERFGPGGLTDGHGDAFRHAYWNALMTRRYGEEWTRDFATAHERAPTGHEVPVAMDLHNNEVGRDIARANPDAGPGELAELVERAVRDGRTLVVDRSDVLVPSNEVAVGQTRASDVKPWPVNVNRGDDRDPGKPSAVPDGY
ncbi:DUF6973 domain-containing protein [Actinosynnema mirum]|uniref:DUF6973 domain-containing protein n=1 Tax=Actinosynnema mirum (strain ATCC 29888 / DSM 43827 / JCM 3225 / NBRC 14064 / NCIMB 13271 / NRRL B-12336 / IMRU 3971 / 101) TaxID=446462 RepID=C6WP65_ACTMD|nr:hypothetical protein [Actinosynnema mirum]ACU38567.1 hypothetical protein Amir_4738 [Actinosynnema mirum DSM 43827]